MSDISKLCESQLPKNDLVITHQNVTNIFQKLNTRKAAGPDAICGHTLYHCAGRLSELFTKLFPMSAVSGQISKIWKSFTFIPDPKTGSPSELKEFIPIALTSLVMKNKKKSQEMKLSP